MIGEQESVRRDAWCLLPGMIEVMNTRKCILIIAIVQLCQGCSSDEVQRAGYETLQSIEDQRCSRDLTGECPRRKSFDDYQRDRHAPQSDDDVP